MTTENICKYCKKEFSYQKTLLNHQKTAKYCIKIQQALKEVGNNTDLIDIKNFNCEYCDKIFTSKSNLHKHTLVCVNRFESIINEKDSIILNKDCKINELQNIIFDLEQQIKTVKIQTELDFYKQNSKENQSTINEIAKQPRVSTTNNNHNKILINTPVDLSQPTVALAIQNGFSDEYLIQGQKGVARFAVDNILKDEQGLQQ